MTAGLFRIVIHFNGMHLLAVVAAVVLVTIVWAKTRLGRMGP